MTMILTIIMMANIEKIMTKCFAMSMTMNKMNMIT